MPLTRIDSAFLDLDAIGGIDFDVQSGVPTLSVDATTHRVGIGTDVPIRDLSVYNDSNTGIEIKSGTTGQSSVFFTDTADANIGMIGYYHTDDSMFFRTNDEERVRITSDGYLKLSGRNVQGTANGDKLLRIYQPSRTDSEENVILLQSYNTSTENDLKIGGGDSSFNAVTSITFRTAGINTTSGSDRLRITSDGNVGIGTDNPSSVLHVNGFTTLQNFSSSREDGSSSFGPGGRIDFLTRGSNSGVGGSSGYAALRGRKYTDATNTVLTDVWGITLDGAAEFAGTINVGGLDLSDTNASGIEVRAGGELMVQRPSSQGTSAVLDIRLGNTQTANILGNGRSTFNNVVSATSSSGSGGTNSVVNIGTYNSNNSYVGAYNTNATKVQNSPSIFVYDRTTPAYKMRVWQDGSAYFASNVGIGNDNPQSKLQIENAGEQLRLTYPSIASYIHEVKSNGDYAIDKDGTERLRVTSGGQILFSGTSGDNQFTSRRTNVASSSGDYFFQLNAQNRTPTTVGGLGFHQDGAEDSSRFVVFTRNTGGSNTERLRITSGGNVGIGTTNPASRFEVRNGGTNAISGTLFSGGFTQTITAGEPQIAFVSNIDGTGNPSGTEAARGGIGFSWANASDRTRFIVGTDSNLPVRIYTNNSEKVRVNADGNVGIGTTNPQALLQLGSRTSASPQGNLHIVRGEALGGGTGPSLSLIHGPDGGTQRSHQIYSYIGDLRIAADSNENMELHTGGSLSQIITSSGNVGIGTDNPTGKLHVGDYSGNPNSSPGILYVRPNNLSTGNQTSDNADIRVVSHSSNYKMHLEDHNGSSLFTVRGNGNVGIGTTNPSTKLDVRGGDISFENKLYTDTTSGGTGDTKTLTLPNISEGASYIFTLTRSPSLGTVNVYQALIIFNGNDQYESTSDIVNTAPTNLTITVSNASGGTATITLVNGGVQRFKATVLRVN